MDQEISTGVLLFFKSSDLCWIHADSFKFTRTLISSGVHVIACVSLDVITHLDFHKSHPLLHSNLSALVFEAISVCCLFMLHGNFLEMMHGSLYQSIFTQRLIVGYAVQNVREFGLWEFVLWELIVVEMTTCIWELPMEANCCLYILDVWKVRFASSFGRCSHSGSIHHLTACEWHHHALTWWSYTIPGP